MTRAPAFTVVIPYRQRLANLRLALTSLAEQTIGAADVEVVVGVLELDDAYLQLCREFTGRLRLVSVLSDVAWQVGHARNLALRQATGDVLVLLDADMVLPPDALATLRERHYGQGERVCVAGQMVDYDNNTSDVGHVEVRPYDHYRALLADLAARAAADGGRLAADARLGTPHVIPWAYAWTALVAIPRRLVLEHDLFFDPGFTGYGVEDLEWAYRIARTGTPIVMAADVYGIHLPHVRDVERNRRTEAVNYRYFLRTWPGPDVELACALGDFAANARYLEFLGALRVAAGPDGAGLAAVHGSWQGEGTVAVGVVVDGGGRPVDPEAAGPFDADRPVRVLPLAGLALPWEDGEVAHARVLPAVDRLPAGFRDAVHAEVRRVTARPVLEGRGVPVQVPAQVAG